MKFSIKKLFKPKQGKNKDLPKERETSDIKLSPKVDDGRKPKK